MMYGMRGSTSSAWTTARSSRKNPQDEIETRGIVFCRFLERILGIISKTNRVEELPMPMYPNTKGLRIHVIVKLKCTNAANRLSILAN